MIPFPWGTRDSQLEKDSGMVDAKDQKEVEKAGIRVSVWGDGNVLKVARGDGCDSTLLTCILKNDSVHNSCGFHQNRSRSDIYFLKGLGRCLGGLSICCTSTKTWVQIPGALLQLGLEPHSCNSSMGARDRWIIGHWGSLVRQPSWTHEFQG